MPKLLCLCFKDQWQALQEQHIHSQILSFYHYAFSDNPRFAGIQQVLLAMGAESLKQSAAFELFQVLTQGSVCKTAFTHVIPIYLSDSQLCPALAYCLSWLRVAGGNSVLPPWGV